MSAPFTPGPWDVFDDDSYMVFANVGDVATVVADADPVNQRTPQSAEECMANACLIASAPELYEALRDAANTLQNLATRVTDHGSSPELRAKQAALQEQADRAFAALAKARGETA
jgi:hypothetical protein